MAQMFDDLSEETKAMILKSQAEKTYKPVEKPPGIRLGYIPYNTINGLRKLEKLSRIERKERPEFIPFKETQPHGSTTFGFHMRQSNVFFDAANARVILSKAKKPMKVFSGIDVKLAKLLTKRSERVARGRWATGENKIGRE